MALASPFAPSLSTAFCSTYTESTRPTSTALTHSHQIRSFSLTSRGFFSPKKVDVQYDLSHRFSRQSHLKGQPATEQVQTRKSVIPAAAAAAGVDTANGGGVGANEVSATARYLRMSADKARRVIDQIRGRTYEEVLMILELMPYRACYPIFRLVYSAASNGSHNLGFNKADLVAKWEIEYSSQCESLHHLEKYASGGQLGSGLPHLHGPREVYTADGHPGSGLPPHLHSPREVYPPPYINTSSSVHSNSVAVPRKWSTGLCHCCDDFSNCVVTCFCPCITFGQIAEIVNKGSSSCASNGVKFALLNLTGFACFYSCFYRSKLRGQYDLEEEPCVDCLVHFFCCFCALCQEYRELKSHGFDMGIGWEANLDRQRRGVTVAPIVGPGMTR